jgi:hypothetical protein
VNYSIDCKICPQGGKSVYIGETSRNLFTRGKEHLHKYEGRKTDSFMLKHQTLFHPFAKCKDVVPSNTNPMKSAKIICKE